MDAKLFGQGIIKFVCGVVIIGMLLFVPAGSFGFWQGGYLCLHRDGTFCVPMEGLETLMKYLGGKA